MVRKMGKYLERGRQENKWLPVVNLFMGINWLCHSGIGEREENSGKTGVGIEIINRYGFQQWHGINSHSS